MLTDQYVLSWIWALHSSCLSNWMQDPFRACRTGEMLQRGMRPEQCSKTSRLQPLLLLFCWQRIHPYCGGKLKSRSNCCALGWVRLEVGIGAQS